MYTKRNSISQPNKLKILKSKKKKMIVLENAINSYNNEYIILDLEFRISTNCITSF